MNYRTKFRISAARGLAPFALVILGLASVAGLAGGASRAEAQSLTLNRYTAAETSDDGFAISRPNDIGQLGFGAQLHLDYALNPLVYQRRASDPGTEEMPLVEHQLTARVGLALGLFERLVIYATLPANLVMDGYAARPGDVLVPSPVAPGVPQADGAGLGDLSFGLRGRLFGEPDDAFAISLQVTGTAPTARAAARGQQLSGELDFTIHPELLMELRLIDQRLRIGANFGGLVRETTRFTQSVGGNNLNYLEVRDEFTWGVGVTVVAVPDLLDLHLESWGATGFERFGQTQISPAEWLLGAKIHPIEGLTIGVAGGTGLARAYGEPDFRAVLNVGYTTPRAATRRDADEDGLYDDEDECPNEPEDIDEFEDENGCPDPDNDQDGILDEPDRCPNEAEDIDHLADEDGCPEDDADGDTVPDTTDACPEIPGVTEAAHPSCLGCPSYQCEQRAEPEPGPEPEPEPEPEPAPTGMRIEQRVYFNTNDHHIRASEMPRLEQIARYLNDHPEILRVLIEGHADPRGAESDNLTLSQRRAIRVRRWLARNGVSLTRIRVTGCGELAADGSTAEGLQENRHVELHVIDPPGASTPTSGCRAP